MRNLIRNRRSRARANGKDKGLTMVAVLASFLVLVVMVLGSVAYVSASTKASRNQQDSELALAAAQSGLNELMANLRVNPTYLYNAAIDKDNPDGYCKNDATGGPDGDHFATICGWGTDTAIGWAALGGESGTHRQYYHYAVTRYSDISESIEVISTGRSNNVYQTLRANIARESTPMFLYISNYELADPTDPSTYSSDAHYVDKLTSEECGGGWGLGKDLPNLGYAWYFTDTNPDNDVPARRYDYLGFPRKCYEPAFEAWDVLDGPVHSNDSIRANGTQFVGSFTTSNPACLAVTADTSTWNKCVVGSALFSSQPTWHEARNMPTVAAPKSVSEAGIGCTYQGPTRIILGDPLPGQMRVWSKWTTDAPALECGTLADLHSESGAVVKVPDDPETAFIFVESIDTGLSETIKSGAIGGTAGRTLPLGNYQGVPTSAGESYSIELAMESQTKQSSYGNLYIEGRLDGQLTVAAERDVIITGDLVTEDPAEDLLGVIGGAGIEIYNPVLVTYTMQGAVGDLQTNMGSIAATPVAGWPTNYDGDPDTLTIHAALHAQEGSFRLQNYKYGGVLGTLYLYGSLAQNFRGVVAWKDIQGYLASGYQKWYQYNEHLNDGQPLLFAPVVNGNWIISWMEKIYTPEKVRP
jgi:Tfp pilus assembly protein PilX